METFMFKMQVFLEDTDSFGIVHHANANYIKKFTRRLRRGTKTMGVSKGGVRSSHPLVMGGDSFPVHDYYLNKFMERARLKWLLSMGFRLDKLFSQGLFFVIRKIDIEYLAPARLYDELEIVSKVISTRRVDTVYEQIICNAHDPVILYCKAFIHVVCVNDKLRPQAMPRELLERYNDH